MTINIHFNQGNLADEDAPPIEGFFAPSDQVAIDSLLADHQRTKTSVLAIVDFMDGEEINHPSPKGRGL